MSRRASLFAKQNPDKPRPKVRFSDELVFLDNIKENDIPALGTMLRRASLQVDISGINDAGLYIHEYKYTIDHLYYYKEQIWRHTKK